MNADKVHALLFLYEPVMRFGRPTSPLSRSSLRLIGVP